MNEKDAFRPQKFAVVGAGPVGCIVAAFLARQGHDVTLCDVIPELIEPALKTGIVIEGAENLRQTVSRITTSIDDLEADPPDVIFITVKANANALIASAIEGFHREGLFVVSWQNGIDTERVFADVLGDQSVMRAIADALTECGLATAHTDQIISMVWRKAILNACMNPVCAVTGMTMAQAMTDPIVFPIVDALVKECVKVARANEIELGWNFYPHAIDYMSKAGSHKPSMLMDIEARRRTEIDFINGKFVAYGLQAGIETPFNITLQALVKGLESQF
jgi:2-dehydropantoate 2-reductase